MLEVLELDPGGQPRATVIWLHGLGADGRDFAPLIRDWGLVDELRARFVLPNAPLRPVTLNNGMVMRAWYDLYDLSFASGEDYAGIESARCELEALIAAEQERGVPPQRILLAGFSQGGALALYTALRSRTPLAGVLALSTYLPLADRLAAECHADRNTLLIRMDHGDSDTVVPLQAAERARNMIESYGYKVEFHQYSMGHSLCPLQMKSLREWVAGRLA